MLLWNLAVAVGIVGLLTAHTQSREYAEFIWAIDVGVMVVLVLNMVNLYMTITHRVEPKMYVSLWYISGTLVWMPLLYFIGNVMWNPPTGAIAAIISPVRASAGIGFAVPSVIVQKVVPVLIEEGSYVHPWLGISGGSLNPDLAQAMDLETDQRGALVVDVVPGGPADEADLRGSDRTVTVDGEELRVGGDVIVAIDGQSVESFDDLVTYLVRSTEAGQTVTLLVLRDGREQQIEVTLGERPGQEQEARVAADETAFEGAWLGITGVTLSPQVAQAMELPENPGGVLVGEVVSGGPADKAGLRGSYKPVTIDGQRLLVGGDVIVAWDGQPVTEMEQLRAFVGRADAGQEVTLTVLRDGAQIQIQVALEARPAS